MQGLHRGCEHEQGLGCELGSLHNTGSWLQPPRAVFLLALGRGVAWCRSIICYRWEQTFYSKEKRANGAPPPPLCPPVFHGTAPGGGCVGSPLIVGAQKELLRSPSGLTRSLYLQHFCRRSGVAPNSVSPSFGSHADCQCRHLIITLLHPGTTAVEATTSDLIIRNLQLYIL